MEGDLQDSLELLLWRGGGACQTGQVRVARLLRSRHAHLKRARIIVTPNLRMSVGKIQGETVIVAMGGDGGEIEPDMGGGICDKKSVVNAPLVFIKHDPQLRRASQVRIFGIKRDEIIGRGRNRPDIGIPTPHKAVHGVAANAVHILSSEGNALVSWTTVQRNVLLIWVKFSLPDQLGIGRLRQDSHVAFYPHGLIVCWVGFGEQTIVFMKVHSPSQPQLSEVREARGALRFYFGAAEYGKKQRGKQRDSRNNRQELNKRETPAAN